MGEERPYPAYFFKENHFYPVKIDAIRCRYYTGRWIRRRLSSSTGSDKSKIWG